MAATAQLQQQQARWRVAVCVLPTKTTLCGWWWSAWQGLGCGGCWWLTVRHGGCRAWCLCLMWRPTSSCEQQQLQDSRVLFPMQQQQVSQHMLAVRLMCAAVPGRVCVPMARPSGQQAEGWAVPVCECALGKVAAVLHMESELCVHRLRGGGAAAAVWLGPDMHTLLNR